MSRYIEIAHRIHPVDVAKARLVPLVLDTAKLPSKPAKALAASRPMLISEPEAA